MRSNSASLFIASVITAVIGLVLIFALRETMLGPVELPTIGWILIAAAVALLLGGIFFGRSRRIRTTEQVSRTADGRGEVREVDNELV